jgi:hypothetical protein
VWVALAVNAEGESQAQKQFRVYENGVSNDILITIYDATPAQPDETAMAESGDWMVQVSYKASPDTILFEHGYDTQEQAKGVFDDLVKAAAEVEGFLRQEQLDRASEATENLKKKFDANTSNVPEDIN